MSSNEAYILIDRTGSMASKWGEVISGVNGFVEGLPKGVKVQVDAFDSGYQDWYTTIRSGLQASFEPLTEQTITPRGMTALNDALGHLMSKVNASKAEKIVVAVITDGLENASKEYKAKDVKGLIAQAEAKGIEIVWLGAEFSGVETQAMDYGLAFNKTMNVGKGKVDETYRGLGLAATSFYSGASASMSLSNETKAAAAA